jgi:glycosyltransferase involved in cell wall biosynthesis
VGPPFDAVETTVLESLRRRRRITTVAADDQMLSKLYRSSAALISSSRYEGFGLPVLEAMASGCPVICTDIPAAREVAGEAATYYTAGSAEELAAAVLWLREDVARWTHCRTVGLERASTRTWLRTGAATLAAYERLQ